MIVKLLTEHHLVFLSLKGGCTGSSESTLVKMPHCLKSRATAHMLFDFSAILFCHYMLFEPQYCKFGNFCDNFIFANSVKRHICDANNSQLRAWFTYISKRQRRTSNRT